MFRRLVYGFIGANLLAVCLNIIIVMDIGMSPFDTATLAFQEFFNIAGFGDASFILHLSFAVIMLLLYKKLNIKVKDIFISILCIFLITRLISLYSEFIKLTILDFSYITFLVAFITLNFGLFLMSKSNMIIAPYDKLVVEISLFVKKELGIIRTICDSLLIVVVVLLILLSIVTTTISIGTVFITVFTGLNIKFYNHFLGDFFKNYN